MRRALALCILLSSRIYVLPELRNCKTPVICGGKPGWVDLEALNKACKQEKCEKDEEIQKLTDQVLRLQKQLEVLKSETEALKTTTAPTSTVSDYSTAAIYDAKDVNVDKTFRCVGLNNKVIHEGKCYWAILPENEVKFLAADKLCKEKGATPANIYSEVHYQKVMNYLRGLRQEFYYVYIGMEYEPESGGLKFYDGSVAQFSHWRAGDPVAHVADPVSMNRVAIDIYPDAENAGNGMLTTSAIIWPKKGVLCEM